MQIHADFLKEYKNNLLDFIAEKKHLFVLEID